LNRAWRPGNTVEDRGPSVRSQMWSHSPPFGAVHRRLRTAHPGRSRMRAAIGHAGQHCWKACWGQPLASSNLASSATLTCDNAKLLRWQIPARGLAWSQFWSQLSVSARAVPGTSSRCCAWSRASRSDHSNRPEHPAEPTLITPAALRLRPNGLICRQVSAGGRVVAAAQSGAPARVPEPAGVTKRDSHASDFQRPRCAVAHLPGIRSRRRPNCGRTTWPRRSAMCWPGMTVNHRPLTRYGLKSSTFQRGRGACWP